MRNFSKYQPSDHPKNQTISLKQGINKISIAKADSVVDKILSCRRVKLSFLKTLNLDSVETRILLSNYAQQLLCKNADVQDLYFTLRDGAVITPTLVLNEIAKAKREREREREREETGSFSKQERQKLHRLYTQGGAAYGSVHNLVKADTLPVSRERQFFHSKRSYTTFTLAKLRFKRLNAIARLKKEIWCKDIEYVDRLAEVNNGVEYLLVRQDVFDGNVNAG